MIVLLDTAHGYDAFNVKNKFKLTPKEVDKFKLTAKR